MTDRKPGFGCRRPARLIRTLLLAALGMLSGSPARAADGLRAWLDRDTMQFGETVTLNIEADSSLAAQPDFSVLDKDFDQIGSQSSRQVSIVNGESSAKTLWAIGLEPHQAGRLTIPPIRVGTATTKPLTLTVLPAPSGARGQVGDDVFLTVSAEPLTPYVQQQVRYTTKLYYAFNLTSGDLADPKADGIVSQRLGQDHGYVAELGGRRYHVVERHYALTPERSGELVLPAIEFRGSALDASDPTGFFSRGRRIEARSDAITLNVRPQPDSWSGGAWLPAAALLLADQSPPPGQVRVGEPITRTIRLQAQGLGYEQLPEIELPDVGGAETYPDKAQTRTRDDGTWIFGERVRKFAFVPSRPGKLRIPGITVRWWNTSADRAETASLPAQTVEVLPASGTSAPARPPAPETSKQAAAARTMPASTRAEAPTGASSVRVWQALAALAILLWLGTLALLWRRGRRASRDPARASQQLPRNGTARAQMLRACALGDLVGAERALLSWARETRPRLHNLGEVAARLDDPEQRDVLAELARVRYAGDPPGALVQRLERAFGRGIAWRDARTAAGPDDDALPPLYPPRAGGEGED